MKENIEEDIKILEKMLESYIKANECGLSNNDFKHEIKALSSILSEYRRLKDKLEQAEKHLIEVDKRIEQTKSEEEEIVLWVIGIRLDERIKAYKELLGKATDNLTTKFVSKIKIREKIDKLEKELDFYVGRDGKICDDLGSQIRALKELLEEGK